MLGFGADGEFVIDELDDNIISFWRPSATLITGGWTNELGGTDLAGSINEAVPSDSDYIKSQEGLAPDTAVVTLVGPLFLMSDIEPIVVRFRAYKIFPGGMVVKLISGQGTELASRTFDNLGRDTFANYSFTLTPSEAAAVIAAGSVKLSLTQYDVEA